MASVFFIKRDGRWCVQWRTEANKTRRRGFSTEAEARAFVPPDERARQHGRRRNGRRRTEEGVLHSIADRFEIDDAGCWVWTGNLTTAGYGSLTWKESDDHPVVSGAHRLVMHVGVERVPADKVIDHLCRNRACVNPDHLEVVGQRENVMRSPIAPGGVNARKTHCPQGHEYTPENTYVYTFKTKKTTTRICRACQRAYHRSYQLAKKGAAA